jgi:hypothetical protein
MQLKMFLTLALISWSSVSNATNTEDMNNTMVPLEPIYETFTWSKEKFEHLIVDLLHHCNTEEECLTMLKSAGFPGSSSFLSSVSMQPFSDVIVPLLSSFAFQASGFEITESSHTQSRKLAAFFLIFPTYLLYLTMPMKYKEDMDKYHRNPIDINAFIERLNKVIIDDNNVLNIVQTDNDSYEIKIHPAFIDELKQLDKYHLYLNNYEQNPIILRASAADIANADDRERTPLPATNQTFQLSPTEIYHLIVALRNSSIDDIKLAVFPDPSSVSLFSNMDAARWTAGTMLFFTSSMFFWVSGTTLGGDHSNMATDISMAAGMWFVGILFYSGLLALFKHDQYQRDCELIDIDGILARLNGVTINKMPVCAIFRKNKNYQITIFYAPLINILQQLNIKEPQSAQ